jgi:hypothetical protein
LISKQRRNVVAGLVPAISLFIGGHPHMIRTDLAKRGGAMLAHVVGCLVATFLVVSAANAAGEGRCRWLPGSHGVSADAAEWLDGATPRGARLIDRSSQWKFLLWLEGVRSAHCEKCLGGQGLHAFYQLELGDPDTQDAEALLHPDNVANALRIIPGVHSDLQVRRLGASNPIGIFGFSGRVSTMTLAAENPPDNELVAIAAKHGCLSVLVVGSPAISTESDFPLASSISLQQYEPQIVPAPSPVATIPAQPQECDFPLGDARKRCQEKQR